MLVCGHDLLSVTLLVLVSGKNKEHVCVVKRNILLSLLFLFIIVDLED